MGLYMRRKNGKQRAELGAGEMEFSGSLLYIYIYIIYYFFPFG